MIFSFSGTDGCLKLHRLEYELAGPSPGVRTPREEKPNAGKKQFEDQLLCVDETSDVSCTYTSLKHTETETESEIDREWTTEGERQRVIE